MYLNPLNLRLRVGQTTMHRPHLMHLVSSTILGCVFGMACVGQSVAHLPHSIHDFVPDG